MARKPPPIEHRFPANRPYAPHTKKHPNGYLTPLLKRLLTKKIKYEDPETRKMIQGKVKDAVIWRLILNATEGETNAIREILDRIDGKLKSDALVDQSTKYNIQIIDYGNRRPDNTCPKVQRADSQLAT